MPQNATVTTKNPIRCRPMRDFPWRYATRVRRPIVPDTIVLGFFKTEIGDFSKADCLRFFSTLDFSRRIFFDVFSPTVGDLQCGLPCVHDISQFTKLKTTTNSPTIVRFDAFTPTRPITAHLRAVMEREVMENQLCANFQLGVKASKRTIVCDFVVLFFRTR